MYSIYFEINNWVKLANFINVFPLYQNLKYNISIKTSSVFYIILVEKPAEASGAPRGGRLKEGDRRI